MTKDLRYKLYVFLIGVLLFSVFYGKFFLSLSMIGMSLLAFFNISAKPLRIAWRPSVASAIKHPITLSFGVMVMVYVLSGLYTENLIEWWDRVRTKAPFLFLTIALLSAPLLATQTYRWINRYFIALASVSFIMIWMTYMLDPGHYLSIMEKGQPIPTPVHHIRYSLLLAMAAMFALHSVLELEKERLWKWFSIVALVLLVVGLHFMSVRSGLATFYLGALTYLLVWVWRQRQWMVFSMVMTGLLIAPIVAYSTMPTLRQKIVYVLYDWNQHKKGEGQQYSDSERLFSIQTGWQAWRENPILGVGIGDIKATIKPFYDQHWQGEKIKLPHNQFVYVMLGCGLLGAIVFFIGFYGPLFLSQTKSALLLAIYVMISATLMIEYTLETAIGSAITLFFILYAVKMGDDLGHPA